jgi:hypothetical protein
MVSVERMVSQAAVALTGLVLSRALLKLAHAHGWHPENQIAGCVMSLKAWVRDLVLRLRFKFGRPPRVADAPGLVWRRRKRDWLAVWEPSKPRPKTMARRVKLWAGRDVDPVAAQFISDICVAYQHALLEARHQEVMAKIAKRAANSGIPFGA